MVSRTHALCMRVRGGRVHVLRDGSTGYIHPLGGAPVHLPPKSPKPVAVNVKGIIDEWTLHTCCDWVVSQAASLGVSPDSLEELGCCYAPPHRAAAFPMRDGYGNMVGIRLRADSGAKWTVKGTHSGLFYPESNMTGLDLWIVEGPTNTAAAITLGLQCVGRPSCNSGVHDIVTLVRRNRIRRVISVADNDPDKEANGHEFNPGLDGANTLSKFLPVPHATIMLPCKDMRDFVQGGGSLQLLECLVNDTTWRMP